MKCVLIFGLILCPSILWAGLFSFLKCEGDGDSLCRLCLATNARGSNKVCSRLYKESHSGMGDGKTEIVGFKDISHDIRNDLKKEFIKLKEFPHENFEIKEFYEKYADYTCERADEEVKKIDQQIEVLADKKKAKVRNESWTRQQKNYLSWKREKVILAVKDKKCTVK